MGGGGCAMRNARMPAFGGSLPPGGHAAGIPDRRRMAVAGLAFLTTFWGLGKRRGEAMEIKRAGSRPSGKGPAEYFTGAVRVDPLFEAPNPARVRGASVTFEP